MAGTLPIGHWSWHERWMYPDQIRDLPEKPMKYVQTQRRFHRQHQQQQQQQQHQQQSQTQQRTPSGSQSARFTPTQYVGSSSSASYPPSRPPSNPPSQSQSHSHSSHSTSALSLNLDPLLHGESNTSDAETALACFGSIDGLASNNPQAELNRRFPDLPRRYRDGTFKRTTSEYCYTYRDPSTYSKELGTAPVPTPQTARVTGETQAVAGSRLPQRERGRVNFDRERERDHVRPEQHSFRLWGRINNAHCVVPYETESQRSYNMTSTTLTARETDPIDRQHFMTVERKDYAEALAKAKFQQLIRGGGGYDNSKRK